MNYFTIVTNKIWRILKIILCITNIAVALLILFNATNITVEVSLISGVIVLICAVLLLADTTGMQKALNTLNEENMLYKESNETYKDLNKKNTENIRKLDDEIKKANLSIQKLDIQNNKLSENNSKMEEQNIKLENENKTYADNNKKMQKQIQNLKIIQDNANNLIRSLMAAGDDFKEFGNVIKDSVNKMDSTANLMEVLVNKLQNDKFSEIDANNDGMISSNEFESWLKSQT